MSDSSKPAAARGVSFTGPAPSPEEAAAAVAAIERFVSETTAAPRSESSISGWQRAALIEGVSAKRRAFPPDPGDGFPVSS